MGIGREMSFDLEIEFAVEAVRRAAQVTRRVQAETLPADGVLQKADQSPVTVADFASQAVVARALVDAFGADPLVGEEDAAALRADAGTLAAVTTFVRAVEPEASPESVCEWIDHGRGEAGERFWTLDPIDGTKGYLRREQYAVALALIVGGRVQVAALACPALLPGGRVGAPGPESGIIAAAVRGRGAFWLPMDTKATPRPLRVSKVSALGDARFLRSVEAGHTNLDEMGELAAGLGVRAAPVGLDSQAKYAVLAGGHGDVLLRLLSPKKPDYREMIWDQAAGSLVVEEAGGRVSDLAGRALDFSQGKTLSANRGVCVTNGHLHEAILEGLAAMKAAGAREVAR
jgi:3'(2'), 5'-bisphosphate nucleotidase